MNAGFFVLTFTAALNPKLLALDLLLIENRRPRAMFLCVLLGGMIVALTIGLLDVLTVHADAITSQGKASAGVDLAVGLLLLTAGGLLATGRRRLARARRASDNSQLAPPHVLGDELGDARALHGPLGHTRRRDLRCRDRIVGGHCGPSGAGRHLAGAMGRHRYLPLVPSPLASDVTVAGHWLHLFGIRADPPFPAGMEGASPS